MRTTSTMLATCTVLAALITSGGGTASAQSIDLGRGELPLHVPASYSEDAPVWRQP